MLELFRTLPALVKDIEGGEAIREAMVFAAWRRAAGDSLAEHAVPLRLGETTLRVAVSSLTWQRHLQDLAGQILFKLNAALGTPTVSYIEFEIDDEAVERSRTRPTAAPSPSEIENAITPELASAAATIADEDLRRQFLLAAGNCLASRRSPEP